MDQENILENTRLSKNYTNTTRILHEYYTKLYEYYTNTTRILHEYYTNITRILHETTRNYTNYTNIYEKMQFKGLHTHSLVYNGSKQSILKERMEK